MFLSINDKKKKKNLLNRFLKEMYKFALLNEIIFKKQLFLS